MVTLTWHQSVAKGLIVWSDPGKVPLSVLKDKDILFHMGPLPAGRSVCSGPWHHMSIEP